jgi:hypothetical protein
MKQTTLKFEKKVRQPLTLERLQAAIDLITISNNACQSLRQSGLSGSYTQYLIKAKLIERVNGKEVKVIKPILERKDFYRIMDIQSKHYQKLKSRRNAVTNYTELPKADTDMLGLVSMPSNKPVLIKRTAKPRIKKAVALPWWKRFLLYLLNH